MERVNMKTVTVEVLQAVTDIKRLSRTILQLGIHSHWLFIGQPINHIRLIRWVMSYKQIGQSQLNYTETKARPVLLKVF